MKGLHVEDLLSAYLGGDLPGEQAAEIRRHLASCPECASLRDALAEVQKALASAPELTPSPELLRRLYAIAAPARKKFPFNLGALLQPAVQPILAGATGVLVLISFLFFSSTGRTFQKQLNRQVHLGYSKIERLYVKAGALTEELSDRKNMIIGSLKEIKTAQRES